jgi:hypothetical protein
LYPSRVLADIDQHGLDTSSGTLSFLTNCQAISRADATVRDLDRHGPADDTAAAMRALPRYVLLEFLKIFVVTVTSFDRDDDL